MDLGYAAVIAGRQAIQYFREPIAGLLVDSPHDSEINRHNCAIGFDEEIALVHVGVEIAGLDRLLEEGVDQPLRDFIEVMAGGCQFFAFGNLDAVNPVQREHAAGCPFPVDVRNLISGDTGHVLGQLRRGGGLTPQVEFAHRPAAKIGYDEGRAQALRFASQRFEMGGGPFIGLDVLRELPDDPGPQYLHRNVAAVQRRRTVYLRNRCRTDRLGIDMGEKLADRPAETEFDLFPDLVK